jgi:transposase
VRRAQDPRGRCSRGARDHARRLLGSRLQEVRGGCAGPSGRRDRNRLHGELYDIHERAGNDLDRKAELRRSESAEVIGKLKTWLWSQAVLKTLSIGKAAAHAIANWEKLTRFVSNPLVPLDNNATERAIRGPVVGRKNHYGSKSRRGTEVAATLYSLIETAKLHNVDPARYLLEAIRASDRREILLPWQMADGAN